MVAQSREAIEVIRPVSVSVPGSQTSEDGRHQRRRPIHNGGVDLTSPAGKMTMAVIAAVAEFEGKPLGSSIGAVGRPGR